MLDIAVIFVAAISTGALTGLWFLSSLLGVLSTFIHIIACPSCREETKRLIISRFRLTISR